MSLLPEPVDLFTGFISTKKMLKSVSEEVLFIHHNKFGFILDYILAPIFVHKRGYLFDSRITYRGVDLIFAQAPYDTNCNPNFDQIGSGTEAFFNRVNKKSVELYGFALPYVRITNESSDIRLTTKDDFKNETFRGIISSLLKRDSPQSSCFAKYHVTTVKRPESHKLSASMYWPIAETLVYKYVPSQEVIDFVVYICSCIGIWFGLSAHSFMHGIAANYLLIRGERKPVGIKKDRCDRCPYKTRVFNMMRVFNMKMELMRQIQAQHTHLLSEI